MAITSSTTTSLDVSSLVTQLMAVERQPITKLNTKVTDAQAKISSFGTISSLMSTFQTAAKAMKTGLQSVAATPSDASVFAATAGSTALPGNYTLSVSQLAQSQSLVAAGQTSSSTAIGDGTATTVTFASGGSGTASITIDSSNNTLEGIRDAINAGALGVTASIVNDGSGTPYRLALTSTSSGASNSFTITTSGGDGAVSGLLDMGNLTQTLAAQDALLTVNGIAITSASNTVSEAIQGVTLTLKNTTTTPASLAVTRDTAAIETAATSFVDAYNALATQIKSRSAYSTTTSTGGSLAGDGTLRAMQDQLRGIFNTSASGGTLTSLAQVGIAFQSTGLLALDSSKLESAMATNFSDVTNLFSSSTGFATRLEAWAKSSLAAGGLIDTRTQSLNTYVSDRNDDIEKLELRMTAIQKRYTTEYTNLNLMLSSMNSTSTYLSNNLASTNSSS